MSLFSECWSYLLLNVPKCVALPDHACPYQATGIDVHFTNFELHLCAFWKKKPRRDMNGAHIGEALLDEIKQKTKSGSEGNIMPSGIEKSTSDQEQRMNISTLSPSDSSFSSPPSSQGDAEAVCGLISGTFENKSVLVQPLLSYIVFALQIWF